VTVRALWSEGHPLGGLMVVRDALSVASGVQLTERINPQRGLLWEGLEGGGSGLGG
jgi:hypothetical protein